MEAMLQKNPHLFWSFIIPWDSRICQLRQRTTSKSHGLLEASVIAHNFCCPHPRISQGRECVQGKPLSGFPCTFSHPPAGDRFCAAKPYQHEKRHAEACLFSCWYARLDSNQRPLESELSGRQAGKPCGARVWLVLHKFPPLWRKTSEALSGRASEVFHGSSQIVVCAPRRSYDSVQLSTPTPVSYCTKTAYPARLRCGSELRSVGCVGRRSSTSGSPCPLRSGRTSRRCPLQPSPHGA